MLVRIVILLALVSTICPAEQRAWSRFFDQPPLSVKQGTQRAMGTAVVAAFNPLESKTSSTAPSYHLTVLPPSRQVQDEKACSVPLLKYEVPKQFFVS